MSRMPDSMRRSRGCLPWAPRLVLNFPNTGPTIAEMRPRNIGLAIAKDKVALAVTAYTEKLWSAR